MAAQSTPPAATSGVRRRPRNTNGAVEPPFKLDKDGQPAPSAWARYHQLLCPCERLSPWRKLPSHLRDNEFLLRGYRADWTARQAAFSLFQLHNETFNVWSHLLGFFVFLGIAYSMALNHGAEYGAKHKLLALAHTASQRLHSMEHVAAEKLHLLEHAAMDAVASQIPPSVARWPLFLFLAAACACLLLSSICHLFCCVNEVAPWIWRVDYAGIASLIAASFFPPIYYSFMCHGWWLRLYLSAITLGCFATLVVSLAPRFGGPAWRTVRAATFSALGLFGVVPITHQVLHYVSRGTSMPLPLRHALKLELLMGFMYLLGALLYAKRWPERWHPYVFDYALNSHNLFHLLVVAAALTHVDASLVLLAWRDHHADCSA